jgi:hypothetical protein
MYDQPELKNEDCLIDVGAFISGLWGWVKVYLIYVGGLEVSKAILDYALA